ncbi:MAG: ComF family protein [Chitinophagales bacterium]
MLPLKIFTDLRDIIYPDLCLACSEPLKRHEKVLCIKCQLELPKTDHVEYVENPVAKKFWGKVQIEYAMALYHFHKSSRIQQLMHELKYKGRKDVGTRLGNLLGFHVKQYKLFTTVDYITSVPLHKDKQIKRGYNQSSIIGEGLSEILLKPFNGNLLRRKLFTETQTKKSRIERWDNVKDIFEIANAAMIANKHILIVDDVITTGSTLEACAVEIKKIEGSMVSIAAIAHAEL